MPDAGETEEAVVEPTSLGYFIMQLPDDGNDDGMEPILAHIWPKYFFLTLRTPSPVRHHACLSSYAKLAKTNDAISTKWPKTSFCAQF